MPIPHIICITRVVFFSPCQYQRMIFVRTNSNNNRNGEKNKTNETNKISSGSAVEQGEWMKAHCLPLNMFVYKFRAKHFTSHAAFSKLLIECSVLYAYWLTHSSIVHLNRWIIYSIIPFGLRSFVYHAHDSLFHIYI